MTEDDYLTGFLPANDYRNVRKLPNGLWAATHQFAYTNAIIVGTMFDMSGYSDRWCYHSHGQAKAALEQWDGTGEPQGWHRHPRSGRRRAETDAGPVEWVNL